MEVHVDLTVRAKSKIVCPECYPLGVDWVVSPCPNCGAKDPRTEQIVSFRVGNTDNTAEDLWWHCQCEKHNQYYRRFIFDNY